MEEETALEQLASRVQGEGEEGGGEGALSLLELLWEAEEGREALHGLLMGGSSHLLIIDKDLEQDGVYFLLYVLYELHRCQRGGLRVQVPEGTQPELALANGRITYIKEPPGRDALLSRLRELLGGEPSIVIIPEGHISVNDLADLFRVQVSRLRPAPRPPRAQEQILMKAFGDLRPEYPPIDLAARELERAFYDRLRLMPTRIKASWRKKSREGQESQEHYWVKLYVAWLYRDKAVKIEEGLDSGTVIPDVTVQDGHIVFEIETLYGTGDPLTKLNETLEKYEKSRDVRLVIPNLQALLYMRDLLRFEQELREEGYNVSLWTLRFRENAKEEEGLQRLAEVDRNIRKLGAAART